MQWAPSLKLRIRFVLPEGSCLQAKSWVLAELVIHSSTISGRGKYHEETFLHNYPKRGVQSTKDNPQAEVPVSLHWLLKGCREVVLYSWGVMSGTNFVHGHKGGPTAQRWVRTQIWPVCSSVMNPESLQHDGDQSRLGNQPGGWIEL